MGSRALIRSMLASSSASTRLLAKVLSTRAAASVVRCGPVQQASEQRSRSPASLAYATCQHREVKERMHRAEMLCSCHLACYSTCKLLKELYRFSRIILGRVE